MINIVGLTIGFSVFVMILLYVIDEISYDRYHSKSERICRVINVYDNDGVGEESSSCPFPLASRRGYAINGVLDVAKGRGLGCQAR